MRSPFAPLRRRSLRFRITATLVIGAAILTTVLSLTTLYTVRTFLEDQRVRSSTRQTLFGVLFAREFLQTQPDPEELVTRLQVRQHFDAMVTRDDEWFATSIELTPETIPPSLRTLVAREAFGYEYAEVAGRSLLVFGTPLPPPGTDLYLFFELEDIDRTLSILGRASAAIGVAIVALVLFGAHRLSVGILYPLAAVSAATQQMAEGLLEARVEEVSADEVGQLAASFNRMAEALREMIARERLFVAAVSHELRTPLAALHAAGEVVARYGDRLPPDGREALGLLREDLLSLRELVGELMEISELDSGHALVRTEEVRVRSVAETLLRRHDRTASVEGDDPVVVTDKARLERVLANLIDNAYTHGTGREVRVTVEKNEECSVLVADRGPGIPAEELPHLFERFYKPDRSRTRERGGVGLGLAIARENATLLGGALEVQSRPGDGAVFTLRLPMHPPERGEHP